MFLIIGWSIQDICSLSEIPGGLTLLRLIDLFISYWSHNPVSMQGTEALIILLSKTIFVDLKSR